MSQGFGNFYLMPATVTLSGDGRKVVASAGTAEAIGSGSCTKVIIVAETDNTGCVVVGASTVVASAATRRGVPLFAGEKVEVNCTNLNQVYIDATVTGEGVTFLYEL